MLWGMRRFGVSLFCLFNAGAWGVNYTYPGTFVPGSTQLVAGDSLGLSDNINVTGFVPVEISSTPSSGNITLSGSGYSITSTNTDTVSNIDKLNGTFQISSGLQLASVNSQFTLSHLLRPMLSPPLIIDNYGTINATRIAGGSSTTYCFRLNTGLNSQLTTINNMGTMQTSSNATNTSSIVRIFYGNNSAVAIHNYNQMLATANSTGFAIAVWSEGDGAATSATIVNYQGGIINAQANNNAQTAAMLFLDSNLDITNHGEISSSGMAMLLAFGDNETIAITNTGTVIGTSAIVVESGNISTATINLDAGDVTGTSGPAIMIGSIGTMGTMHINANGGTVNGNISKVSSGTLNINANGSTVNGNITTTGGTGTANLTFGNSMTSIINGAISGFNTCTINTNATAVLNGIYNVPAVVVSNSGDLYIGANFTASAVNNTNSNIHVYNPANISGAFTGSLDNLTIGLNPDGDSVAGTVATFANNITASNIAVAAGTFTANGVISGVSGGMDIAQAATANINAAYTGIGTIANNGDLNIAANIATGPLNNTSTGILTFLAGANSDRTITNAGSFNVSGSATNTGSITNNNNMTIAADLAGAGTIDNTATGTLELATGANVSNDITNDGEFHVSGAATNTGDIINNHNMTIAAALAGAGTIQNYSTLNLQNNANVSNTIMNNAGGDVHVTGIVTINNNFINDADLILAGNLTVSNTLTNNGTTSVSGMRTLTGNYVNNGTHVTTITDIGTYDQLTCSGNVSFNNGSILEVQSSYFGVEGTTESWMILSGASVTITPEQIIMLNTLFSRWSSVIDANSVTVNLFREPFAAFTETPVQAEIAAILTQFANDPQNAAQEQLVQIMLSCTTQEQYLNALNQLTPNANGLTPLVAIQNNVLARGESRIMMASLDDYGRAYHGGYNAGDQNFNTAFWIAPFGSIAKQRPRDEDTGYRATASGLLIGLDRQTAKLGLVGLSVGFSNTIVDESLNVGSSTRIAGTHLLLYGSRRYRCANFFDWLVTGALNRNKGNRLVNINGNDLSVVASYQGFQVGGKINWGKIYNPYDFLQIAPLFTTMYSLLHQPAYTETGSIAALRVSTRTNQSIWYVGGGLQFSLPCDAWWMLGTQQLRVLGTYDVVSASQVVSASFVSGGSDFTIADNPARLALRAGLDMAFMLLSRLQLQLSFDYEVRQDYTDYSGMLKFKYLF